MIAAQSAVPVGDAGDRVDAPAVQFSIVVPLYDCRDAGMGALESALRQDFPRHRYEVIVIADARSSYAGLDALFARCDRVVAMDADFAGVVAEIALFETGSRFARGDYLYFIEGHTVLADGALRAIEHHLTRDPDSAIVCGRRLNHARTRLGRLVGVNNDAHEARSRRQGNFTLGANCVIRRSTFVRLGGFEPRFLRFNETVLYQRAIAAGVRFGAIDAVLCTHHNDTGYGWLVRLLVATGRAKARYYAPSRGSTAQPTIRHPVYRWLASPTAATLAALPLGLAGPILILVATALVDRRPAWARTIYHMGIGCTDVSGYCLERGLGRHIGRMRASPTRTVAPLVGHSQQQAGTLATMDVHTWPTE